MSEPERIARLLEQTFEGRPYYGPSVIDSLKEVTAKIAVRKPRKSTHSIWNLVAHLTAELHYARALLEDTAGLWIEGETTWPAIPNKSEVAWQQAVEELKKANRALVRVVKQLDEAVLDQNLTGVQRPYYIVLHGTIQHNVYHAGQISLLAVK